MKYKLIVSDRLEGIIRNPSVFSEPIQWVFSGPVLRLPMQQALSLPLFDETVPYRRGNRIVA